MVCLLEIEGVGVADLIASIKISKVPIICICNDHYGQKLKGLVNYWLLLSFRKLTKQQVSSVIFIISIGAKREIRNLSNFCNILSFWLKSKS